MPLTSVAYSGASSLYTSVLGGTDLAPADALNLKGTIDAARLLADAIRAAIEQARSSGLASFKATDRSVLALPAELGPQVRDELFEQRVGRPFSASAMTLSEWSDAAEALESWAGRTQSTLPPGLGGGIVFARGLWYVNGQSLTLSEVYLANRVNTYAAMDRLLTDSLNSIAANNEVVHTVTRGLKYMSEKLQQWVGTYESADNASRKYHAAWWLIGDSVYGATDPWKKEWLNFVKWSKETYGSDGQGNRFSSTQADGQADFSVNLSRPDALKLRDELQAYIESKTADNQVAQMRTESVFTTRANLLEGMGAFMKGQQNVAASAARNMGA